MRFNGERPNGPFGLPGPQGFLGQPPGFFGPGASPGGSIRNTLGSGLKSLGVFQKDGKINNMRGGFIGPKAGPQYPPASRPGFPSQGAQAGLGLQGGFMPQGGLQPQA